MAPDSVRRSVVAVLTLTIATVLAAVVGYGWWRYGGGWNRSPDMVAVLQANSRGIGYMEQFEYGKAVTAFEEVVRLAPDWLPGRINLGVALLNAGTGPDLDRAGTIFQSVLKEDADNPYAHFCLGILLRHRGNPDERDLAATHFEAVTRKDPSDAAAWYWLGSVLPEGSERATECYRRAVHLDPQLTGAIYSLCMNLRQADPARAEAALAEYQALRDERFEKDTRGNPIAIEYGEMGRYGDVIGGPPAASQIATGPLPLFAPVEGQQVRLASGARWATAADFGSGATAEVQRRIRDRFGGTMAVLDYNGDGKPDLFLLGAVVENGRVRDLLLRNDGGGRFTDVTAAAGLSGSRRSLGCCVADVDNDGRPDLLVTGVGERWLF